MKKITMATLKAFIRKNGSRLYIRVKCRLDGMTDGIEFCDTGFIPAKPAELNYSNNLGIEGAWVVGGSRDRISAFAEDGYEGMRVSNCCGSFILAIKKSEAS